MALGNPGVWGTAGPLDPSGIGWTQADTDRIARLYGPRPPKGKKRYQPPWLRDLPSSVRQNPALAAVARYLVPAGRGGGPGGGGAGGGGGTGTKALTDQQIIDQYAKMLQTQQRGVLDQLLADSARRRNAEMQSMAGFGAALQGYSHDLWGQTNSAYQNAAAAQQSMAQGLGGQVGSGIAGARAEQAALAGALGQGEGGFGDMPTAEAGAAQVASEGGKDTGGMMGAVGTAWGGYGATRPEYIGFMTGQNQMQIMREAMEGDRDLQSEFLKLGMENPVTAFDMWSKMQENKRQNISTSLAQQTLRTNIAMQKAKLKADWQEARLRAKTAAEKLAVDKHFREVEAGIDQQNADASTTRANASVISAGASAARAQTAAEKAKWERAHPGATQPGAKYTAGTYQEKVASAMGALPTLFERSGGNTQAKTNYAFNVLWGQMAPYVDAKNKARAKALLRQRILNAAKGYKQKPSASGGADPLDKYRD